MPDAVRALLPGGPDRWCRHERLTVDGVAVDWWVDADGQPHAGGADGLARALAWAAGRWGVRFDLAAALADPATAPAVLLDRAFDQPVG